MKSARSASAPNSDARRLILFDIDATLLKTEGAGMAAMGDAGRELFGPAFTTAGVEFAGRLDTLIFRDLFHINRRERSAQDERRLRACYRSHLARHLQESRRARSCPGVSELLAALRATPLHVLGVLTGNFPETGRMKMLASGLDPAWFTVNAWGDDSPHELPDREHLPPVAMARFRELHASDIAPSRVTIVGDTPHDVRCARAHGCRCLAVATGQFTTHELERAGADHVVPDLTRTDEVLRWLGAHDSSAP